MLGLDLDRPPERDKNMPVVPLTDNEHYPQDLEHITSRVRAEVAAQAKSRSQARARGLHDKKFPEARSYSWPTLEEAEADGVSFWAAVMSHLDSYALHLLYVREKGQDQRLDLVDIDPTARREWLAERLVEHVLAVGSVSLYSSVNEDILGRDTKGRIEWERLWRMAEDAAAFAVDKYKPIKQKLQEWGSKGGKASSRGRTKSLDGLEGLSIAEQAEALGVTPRTISRMRADLKKRDEAIAPLSDTTAQTSTEPHFNNGVEVLTDKPLLTDKPEVFDPYDPRCYLKADGSTDWAMLFRAVP
ncbi:hypothetical protein [Curtobacterium flaccumfaciens]|uniref:hypothetical protein n=1 Tax=Curtobacterium flaccumfaciens TaxID=2035 RepID=UPI001E340894|nr:hypothetical protein [Curtobacterium allii]MCE0458435.1 hypothetical protein [Curtobacterium allii]